MMSELAAIQKQLKIKAGVVQRYQKEALIYRNEVVGLQKKMAGLAGEEEDWNFRNTKRMLDESEKMVLDTKSRCDKATGELEDLVTAPQKQVEGKPGVAETKEFVNAQQIVGA